MDLFSGSVMDTPLAVRMRPNSLKEFIGQERILGEGRVLRRAIEEDRLSSMIFFGPSGSGKTTLAHVIAKTTTARFVKVSATSTGVSELRAIFEEAREKKKFFGQKTLLFIDEIQRLHKGQQDVLLPVVEEGEVIVLAATTENPNFEVNKAFLSRLRIVFLEPLTKDELTRIAKRALLSSVGLLDFNPEVEDAALEHLVQNCNGDARILLSNLEWAVVNTEEKEQRRFISMEIAEEAAGAQRVSYDKTGDLHYDVTSAFIKSMRGSDPHAALYWYARMVYAAEDPRFIVRRLLVHAAEDVGLADPTALLMAQSAAYALEYLGMPEARIPIAQAILYIATAPKSNSVIRAVDAALDYVKSHPNPPVPKHLRDTHGLKVGAGYKYPHDYPKGYVTQDYFPEGMKNRSFYEPTSLGREKTIKEHLERIRQP